MQRLYNATSLQCNVSTMQRLYNATSLQCNVSTMQRLYNATSLQLGVLTITIPINPDSGCIANSRVQKE
jgi:hypothetical protein